jgi:hypothetical protein
MLPEVSESLLGAAHSGSAFLFGFPVFRAFVILEINTRPDRDGQMYTFVSSKSRQTMGAKNARRKRIKII